MPRLPKTSNGSMEQLKDIFKLKDELLDVDENCLSKDISGGCHNAHSSLRVEHKSNMSTVTMAWRVGNVNAGPDSYTSKHTNTHTHKNTDTCQFSFVSLKMPMQEIETDARETVTYIK